MVLIVVAEFLSFKKPVVVAVSSKNGKKLDWTRLLNTNSSKVVKLQKKKQKESYNSRSFFISHHIRKTVPKVL